MSEQLNMSDANWQSQVPTGSKKIILAGLMVAAVFLSGFVFWGLRAPLAGAAIAPGVVIASGENQQIGHLEGGIVEKIAVKKGDRVELNQPLVYLNETQALAGRNRVEQSSFALTAALERAKSELEGSEKLDFSETLTAKATELNDTQQLELQIAEFNSGLERHNSELTVFEEQIRAINEEIIGLEKQIEAEESKIVVLDDEILAKEKLLEQGLTPKSQYNTLVRAKADGVGRVGSLKATIGQRRTTISEIRQKQETLKASRKSDASKQVNELRRQLADLQQQLASRADIVDRLIIRAPVSGVIVNIAKNTIGSVVAPGETVLEILPTSKELVISARLSPSDVDVVKVGQEANIRFVALNVRTTPEVPATVEYVSADRLVDPATQEPYFDARLKLTDNLPEEISVEQIFAGMPVDTFIKTGERTFVEYLLKPVTDSFSKAFREE